VGEWRQTSNVPPQRFVLSRIFTHNAITAKSGFSLTERITARKRYRGEFPALTRRNEFQIALARKLERDAKLEAGDFTGEIVSHLADACDRLWSIGRWSAEMDWGELQSWQNRLLTDSVASFAVWNDPYRGGCGNPTSWSGKNFWWRENRLKEFQLRDLFLPQKDWETLVRDECKRRLKSFTKEGLDPSESLTEETSLDVFTVSPTGIQIYFNPYKLASGAEGEFIIHIPWSDLKPLLDPRGPAGSLAFTSSSTNKSGSIMTPASPQKQNGRP
jgi:hypothetical protein